MRFKKYLKEAKKGKIFYMGKDIDVQYEVEKWTNNSFRVRLIEPKNPDYFGFIEKNKREWNAEIKRSRDGITTRQSGIWNKKNDAVEEILNDLYNLLPVRSKVNESPKMGAIWGTGPDMRRYPKTGWSKDFIGQGAPTKGNGFANSTENYYDRLDPRNVKKRKKSWLTGWSKFLQGAN